MNRSVFTAALILISAPAAAETPQPTPDDVQKVCASLETVVRLAVEQRAGQNLTPRLQVALAAHERLNCHPFGLVNTLSLGIPGVDLNRFLPNQ